MPISQERLHNLLVAGETYQQHYRQLKSHLGLIAESGADNLPVLVKELTALVEYNPVGNELAVLVEERTRYRLTFARNRKERIAQELDRRRQGKKPMDTGPVNEFIRVVPNGRGGEMNSPLYQPPMPTRHQSQGVSTRTALPAHKRILGATVGGEVIPGPELNRPVQGRGTSTGRHKTDAEWAAEIDAEEKLADMDAMGGPEVPAGPPEPVLPFDTHIPDFINDPSKSLLTESFKTDVAEMEKKADAEENALRKYNEQNGTAWTIKDVVHGRFKMKLGQQGED